MMAKNSLLILSIGATILGSVAIWFGFETFLKNVNEWTFKGASVVINWSLNRPSLIVSLGCLPLAFFVLGRQTGFKGVFGYLLGIVGTLLGYAVMVVMGYGVALAFGKDASGLLPEYIVLSPFKGFWNAVLVLATWWILILYFGNKLLFKRRKTSETVRTSEV